MMVVFALGNDLSSSLPSLLGGELSLLEVVVVTIIGRNTGATDCEFADAVSDVFCREIGVDELREVADRLALAELISPKGSIGGRLLTVRGISAVKQAQDCCLRLIDNNSGLVVVSAMMGLFDHVNQES